MTPPQPHQKTLVQKTSHDMQLSLVAFQKAQKVSAERQRTVVEDTKRDLDYETNAAPEDEYVTLSVINNLFIHPYAAARLDPHKGKSNSTSSKRSNSMFLGLSIALSSC